MANNSLSVIMPRGGKRKNAGRRSEWKSGCKFDDTKLIRVPKVIASKLMEIARMVDAGEFSDLETKSKLPNSAAPAIEQLVLLKEEATQKIEVPVELVPGVLKAIERMKTGQPAKKFGFLCPHCKSSDICKHGKNSTGDQSYKCKACTRRFTEQTALSANP